MQKEKLRRFILENFLFTDDESELNDDDSFMENQIIDSTGILEIITFLEERFKVSFEDEELTGDNFDTIERIRTFLLSKLSSGSSG